MSKRAKEKAELIANGIMISVQGKTGRVVYNTKEKSFTHYELMCAAQKGYEQAEKDMIEMAIKWLTDRIDVPCLVATNENGEPLADSYIDYAKKRLEAANKIVDEFRKAMEEE